MSREEVIHTLHILTHKRRFAIGEVDGWMGGWVDGPRRERSAKR